MLYSVSLKVKKREVNISAIYISQPQKYCTEIGVIQILRLDLTFYVDPFSGEVGKEMYIVSRGRLEVVTDNNKVVLATLRPGSYFGEISVLNMGNAGNRRTASVRSVGYSDLFCLSKNDLWEVLKDYPSARVRLEAIAIKRVEKYRNPHEEHPLKGNI